LGAAMAAAVCTGIYRDFPEAVQSMVRIQQRFDPDSELKNIYDQKYQNYKNLVQRLVPK
jgi:ribulose kinase